MKKRYTEPIGPIPNPGIQPIFGQYNMSHIIFDLLHVSYYYCMFLLLIILLLLDCHLIILWL